MSLAGEETGSSEKKRSWPRLSWGVRFAIALTGSIAIWGWQIRSHGVMEFPAVMTTDNLILLTIGVCIFSFMSITLPLWTLLLIVERVTRPGKWRSILSAVLLLTFSLWIMNALSKDWLGARHGGTIRSLILIVPVATILLYPLPIMRMKRKAVALALQGDYEEALRISRTWLRSKVYGRPFQGWIMLEAGRYREALELFKDAAFDPEGKPILKSQYLYLYSVALMCEENYCEAQELLEAAVRERKQGEGHLLFSLADCLLAQNRELTRACELVEQVIADLERESQSGSSHLFWAQCVVVHAWALAADGHREEARARLENTFAEPNGWSKRDLAGLLNLKGLAGQALGDNEMAAVAFQQSLALFPYGSIAVGARKQLAKLGENAGD